MLIVAGSGSPEPRSLPHKREAGQLNLGTSHFGGDPRMAAGCTRDTLNQGVKLQLSTKGQCEHKTPHPEGPKTSNTSHALDNL